VISKEVCKKCVYRFRRCSFGPVYQSFFRDEDDARWEEGKVRCDSFGFFSLDKPPLGCRCITEQILTTQTIVVE